MRESATDNTRPTDPHPSEPGEAQRSDGRCGIRTVILSAVTLVGLVGLAVGVLWSSLGPPEGTAPGRGPATESARTGSEPPPSVTGGPAIAGTISVASGLRGRVSDRDTLFVIARKDPGEPFAVKRIAGPHFPLEYRLGPGDVMMAGTPFEGSLRLSVRLSKSGAAGPGEPGDLEGEYPGQAPVGAREVNIVIARALTHGRPGTTVQGEVCCVLTVAAMERPGAAGVAGAAASGSWAAAWPPGRAAGPPVWFRANPATATARSLRLAPSREETRIGAAGCRGALRRGGVA